MDCPLAQYCGTNAGLCVQGGGSFDADGDLDLDLDDFSLLVSDWSGPNEVCDLLIGQCEPSGMCSTNDQCAAEERCDVTTGECVPEGVCTFDSDCPPGQTCDMVTGMWVVTDP